MTRFDPTPAPLGRLARLGIVLDLGAPVEGIRRLAILCDRAGMDAVWLACRDHIDDPTRWTDPTETAARIAPAMERSRLGMMLPPDPAAMLPSVGGAIAAQEVTVATRDPRARIPRTPEDQRPASRARFAVVIDDLADLTPLFSVADDIVLPGWAFPDLETAADEVRAEAREAGRDPATLGVAAMVPVSIGRTEAEARVRADADPLFARIGHPQNAGIFGTLEECQDRVIALAHAGISDLRCILPASDDVHDVIAQLTAMTIGTTDVLFPGSLRSPAPPPPEGWGGRADIPTKPRVSDGSRRR